jgi:hypothetical protein
VSLPIILIVWAKSSDSLGAHVPQASSLCLTPLDCQSAVARSLTPGPLVEPVRPQHRQIVQRIRTQIDVVRPNPTAVFVIIELESRQGPRRRHMFAFGRLGGPGITRSDTL